MMNRVSLGVCCAGLASLLSFAAAAEQPLVELGPDFDIGRVEKRDVTCEHRERTLRVATGHSVDWPGITLKPRDGRWDLSAWTHVALDVKNVGAEAVDVHAKIESRLGQEQPQSVTAKLVLKPHEQGKLLVPLSGRMPEALKVKLFGMRGYPGGWTESGGLRLEQIVGLVIFVAKPKIDHAFEVSRIRAEGPRTAALPDAVDKLFPLVDQLGQYTHGNWPGKVPAATELASRAAAEQADLAAHAGPADWDQYGGWKSGPMQQASGFFRVQKVAGRWWLVDPEGRLFWSQGIDCVNTNNGTTPISDREFYFADLPAKDSPFGQFFGRGGYAPHGYYKDKAYESYNFTGANLLRKYGAEWKQTSAELAHRRLRSWGLNTIANWSDAQIYLLRKTPYTATIGSRGKTRAIEGSTGYWGKFTDVFDPQFQEGLRKAMAREQGRSAGDPWCLGYFVDNELSWGDEVSLALAALASPADQPAKISFVAELRKKYETIERLNAAWGTAHASWDELLKATTPPDKQKAGADLLAFYSQVAERYFQVCRDAVKEVAPQQLYLGCRFAWVNDRAVRAACKYCDVVSFNRYERSVTNLKFPEGCDKPAIIGEFHFGALDRGMFHTGLVPTASQQERAAAYQTYVRGALENPYLVGTHWFQYGDQATTGRFDGENYQIGFLDICDSPYPETIQACRELAQDLYQRRWQPK